MFIVSDNLRTPWRATALLSSFKVRLMLTLTPVVCVLSSIAFSKTLETYLEQDENLEAEKEKGKKKSPSHGDEDSDEDEYVQSRWVAILSSPNKMKYSLSHKTMNLL